MKTQHKVSGAGGCKTVALVSGKQGVLTQQYNPKLSILVIISYGKYWYQD